MLRLDDDVFAVKHAETAQHDVDGRGQLGITDKCKRTGYLSAVFLAQLLFGQPFRVCNAGNLLVDLESLASCFTWSRKSSLNFLLVFTLLVFDMSGLIYITDFAA